LFRLDEGPFPEGVASHEDDWAQLDLTRSREVELILTACPRSDLEGVITEDGLPLSGAVVRLLPHSPEPSSLFERYGLISGAPTTKTDSSGRYRIEDVKADAYRLEIAHDSRGMSTRVPITLSGGLEKKDIDLSVSCITGRVTDGEGRPVAGALVSAVRQEDEGESEGDMIVFYGTGPDKVVSTGGPDRAETRTDADGRYELRGVCSDQPLVVRAKTDELSGSLGLRIRDGQTRRNVDFCLRPTGEISITAITADGNPTTGYEVVATCLEEGAAQDPRRVPLGFDGRAHLRGCEVGRWRVSLAPPNGRSSTVSPAAAPREVEVRAGETAKLELVVE
jgi:hypothetical protein